MRDGGKGELFPSMVWHAGGGRAWQQPGTRSYAMSRFRIVCGRLQVAFFLCLIIYYTIFLIKHYHPVLFAKWQHSLSIALLLCAVTRDVVENVAKH